MPIAISNNGFSIQSEKCFWVPVTALSVKIENGRERTNHPRSYPWSRSSESLRASIIMSPKCLGSSQLAALGELTIWDCRYGIGRFVVAGLDSRGVSVWSLVSWDASVPFEEESNIKIEESGWMFGSRRKYRWRNFVDKLRRYPIELNAPYQNSDCEHNASNHQTNSREQDISCSCQKPSAGSKSISLCPSRK